jgi:glycosyltransferase involved in cell wall biosynthesis
VREWARAGEDRLVAYFNGPAPGDAVLDNPRIVKRPLGAVPIRGVRWQEGPLPAAAREDGVDVFFAPAYSCPLSLGVPRVTTVHDMSFFSLPEDFGLVDGMRRRALVAASVGVSARVLAVSDFTRREIAAHFPAAASRIVVTPHGADDDLLPPPARDEARARLGLRGPMVLSVGSILNRRNLPVLFHAAARLRRAWPDLTLEVVGENRTHPHLDLPALARRSGLVGGARLSGFVGEAALAERYAAADAFVFLSEYEGFGLPVLEAMARGVPAVTSTRPALGEVFGEAALLVDPRDPTAVAGALDRILRDADLRAGLVTRGRALAARHSWSRCAQLTRAALEEAAQGSA